MWPFSKTAPSPTVQPAFDVAPEPVVTVDTTAQDIADLQDATVRLRENLQWAMDNVTHLLAKVSALESKPALVLPPDMSVRVADLDARLHTVEDVLSTQYEGLNTTSTAVEELRQQVASACDDADAAKKQADEALVKASQKSGGGGGIGSIA